MGRRAQQSKTNEGRRKEPRGLDERKRERRSDGSRWLHEADDEGKGSHDESKWRQGGEGQEGGLGSVESQRRGSLATVVPSERSSLESEVSLSLAV